MKTETNSRGFRSLMVLPYIPEKNKDQRLVSESTAINFDYEDGLENPGSSYLWFGNTHHLDREEVAQVVKSLSHWLEHKRLPE